MYKSIYPSKDATVYEQFPLMNTGTDQIIELWKITSGSQIESIVDAFVSNEATTNSRILIQFDFTDIKQKITSGEISGSVRYYLNLYATYAYNNTTDYEIKAYPLSSSWVNGTGFSNSRPNIQDGVSWKYSDNGYQKTQWALPPSGSNAALEYNSIQGGGVWYTGSGFECSQSFSLDTSDVRMDVTDIVNKWISEEIPNNGFIIKYPSLLETNSSQMGKIQFFSRESHTIFIPKIDAYWNTFTQSNAIDVIDNYDYLVYPVNLKHTYNRSEIAKIYLAVRPVFPTRQYTTQHHYSTTYKLPETSYLAIYDTATDVEVLKYDIIGTKISSDSRGNYITLDMSSFMPERYYRIAVRVENSGSINYFTQEMQFKVVRV